MHVDTFSYRCSEKDFFKIYIKLLSNTKPLSLLRNQEREVLSEIMYRNYILSKDYKDPEDPKKWKALFDYDMKIVMRESLGDWTDQSLANCLTGLRKYKILNDENVLNKKLRIYPSTDHSLTFKFNIVSA